MASAREFSAWNAVENSDLDLGVALGQLGVPVSTAQQKLLEKFRAYYREEGLLDGAANPPLWDCCACGSECWAPFGAEQRVAPKAGITLPWVGPNYADTRVAVLAHNLRDAGGLLVEQQVAADVRRDFRAGRKEVHGTTFAYRSCTAAQAVLATRVGGAPSDGKPPPESLVDCLDATARLQLVKCAPGTFQSEPSAAMSVNCPPRYLPSELELLAPTTLIALGKPVRDALQTLFPDVWRWEDHLLRGRIETGAGACEVYCVAHPSSRGHWWPSYFALKEALVAGR